MADKPDGLPYANTLLSVLAPTDLAALRPHLSRIDLPKVKTLEIPRRRIGTAYFVEQGIVSVVSVGPGEPQVEVGIIGREGMTGIPLLLGDDRWPHSTYMQVGGRGYAIDAAELRRCMAASPSLTQVLLKFVQSFLMQVSATATTRARGRLDERLARWLLMAHDRGENDVITLTHEFLAMMLAVRRAGVTESINALVARGLVRTMRGSVRIIDRTGLERYAGALYGTAEVEYRRLFAPVSVR